MLTSQMYFDETEHYTHIPLTLHSQLQCYDIINGIGVAVFVIFQ